MDMTATKETGKSYRYTCIIIASTPIGECSRVKQSSLLGQAVTQQKGQPEREEVLRAAHCGPAVDCALSISSAVDAGVAFIALLCANCAPTSHTTFPRGVLGESAYTLALQALNSRSNSSDGKSALNALARALFLFLLGLLWP